MRKALMIAAASFCLVFFFGIQTSSATESDDKIVLKVADHLPTTHILSKKVVLPWMDEIVKRTNGKVTFQHFPAQQLIKAKEMVRGLKNKVVDVALLFPSYFPDQFVLSGIIELPGAYNSASEGGQMFYKLSMEEGAYLLQREFLKNEIRPLWTGVTTPAQLQTSEREIQNLNDIKGLKVRSTRGPGVMMMSYFGATPVFIPAPEIRTALQRGTVDGILYPLLPKDSYGFISLVKHSTLGISFHGSRITLCIREETWQALPASIQDIFRSVGKEKTIFFGKFSDKLDAAGKDFYKKQGVKFFKVAGDNLKVWDDAVDSVRSQWIEQTNGRGAPGTETMNQYRKIATELRQK